MKKKTILGTMLTAIFMSAGLYGQQKEISPELQQVLDKLEMLGQQNPAGAFPINQLTEEEKQIYLPYEREIHEKYIRENPITVTEETNRATNKAFRHDIRNQKFGSISLAAPTVSAIQTGYNQQFYADDIAGNGLLYYANNSDKSLYLRNEDGSSMLIGTFKNIVNNQTVSGLSWNPVNSTMYLVSQAHKVNKEIYIP